MGVQQQDKIKLLVVTGCHPFDPRFYHLFEGHPDIEWDKRSHKGNPCSAFGKGFAHEYDVVLLYDFEQVSTEAQRTEFRNAFGKGRGLIVLHHAICNHFEWPTFREMAGGQFFFVAPEGYPAASYKGDVAMHYEFPDPDHPVARGVEAFDAVEEPYKNVYIEKGVTPLMSSRNEHSDAVVAWTKQYGASRVISIMPGHGGDIFVHPSFRRFVAQAIRYAAGRDDTSEPRDT